MVKRFESPYFKEGIHPIYRRLNFRTFALSPLLSIYFWALFREKEERGLDAIESVIYGLREMDQYDYAEALAWAVPIAFALMLLVFFLHNHKWFVLALEFDDEKQQLTLYSKKLTLNKQRIDHVEYEYLGLFTRSGRYDGMSAEKYETIEFTNRSRYVGSLFKGHITWDARQISEISIELTKIGKSPHVK